MALRNILVEATPGEVWAVLADGRSYAEWVVGTKQVREVGSGWPEEGTRLAFTAGLGPLRIEDTTTSRLAEPERRLELEAGMGPAGTIRVSFHLLPWGEHTLVVLDEHPLRGPGLVENPLVEVLLTLRNRFMLARLREVVERRAAGGTAGP